MWLFETGAAQNEAIRQRTALDEVEARAGRLRSRLDARLRRTRPGRRLATRLGAAGVALGVPEFLAVVAAAAAGAYVVVSALVSRILAVVAAALAVRACWWWVQRRQGRRRDLFVAQLPEVARVLSNAASAGLSLRSALEMAAHELEEPAGSELRLTADSMRYGGSVERALGELGRRLPSRELGVLVTTLVIQHRAGGALVSALRDMADTLDARKDLRREIRTIMAGPVFTSYLVAGMGFGSLVLLNLLRPGLVDELLTVPGGQVVFVISAGLFTLGFALVRATARVDR